MENQLVKNQTKKVSENHLSNLANFLQGLLRDYIFDSNQRGDHMTWANKDEITKIEDIELQQSNIESSCTKRILRQTMPFARFSASRT